MRTAPSNRDDVIDSRDVIERIEELEGELEGLESLEDAATASLEDEWAELKALKALADEASGYADDWEYGAALVRDSHFKDYAMELADEIGAIPAGLNWPMTCIDWDQAARELQMDYTQVDFDGVAYWVR